MAKKGKNKKKTQIKDIDFDETPKEESKEQKKEHQPQSQKQKKKPKKEHKQEAKAEPKSEGKGLFTVQGCLAATTWTIPFI